MSKPKNEGYKNIYACGANFDNFDFSACDLVGSSFINCSFKSAKFTGASFGVTEFKGCDFENSDIYEAIAADANERKEPHNLLVS